MTFTHRSRKAARLKSKTVITVLQKQEQQKNSNWKSRFYLIFKMTFHQLLYFNQNWFLKKTLNIVTIGHYLRRTRRIFTFPNTPKTCNKNLSVPYLFVFTIKIFYTACAVWPGAAAGGIGVTTEAPEGWRGSDGGQAPSRSPGSIHSFPPTQPVTSRRAGRPSIVPHWPSSQPGLWFQACILGMHNRPILQP